MRTKNDLSFNKTKLDYAALIRTAEVAYGHTLEQISRYHGSLREWPPKKGCFYLDAEWLANEADKLVIVAETLHTLREMATREELEVVNRPAISEIDAVAEYHAMVAREMPEVAPR